MLMGTYYNSIDAKNRIIVPSKQRDDLGGRCVLTKGLDTCLYIYTMSDWELQLEKIEKLPESVPEIRAFKRSFFGNAVECELDKQGRIVVPATLVEYARIRKDLVTVGTGKKIEIWSKELWDEPGKESTLSTEDVLEKYNY